MSNCIKAILMEELETCVEALVTYQSDLTMDRTKRDDELETWTQRLARVKKALFEVENALYLTQSEWNTLTLLVDYHNGSYDGEETGVPFSLRDFEAILDKLQG